ncbi:9008_t:CDS:2, partial [Racocetra persica]
SEHNDGKPCKDCCKLNSPGWKNNCHALDIQNMRPIKNITTAEKCCKGCLKDPYCIQWGFGRNSMIDSVVGSKANVILCLFFYNNNQTPDICTLPPQPNSSLSSEIHECGLSKKIKEGEQIRPPLKDAIINLQDGEFLTQVNIIEQQETYKDVDAAKAAAMMSETNSLDYDVDASMKEYLNGIGNQKVKSAIGVSK